MPLPLGSSRSPRRLWASVAEESEGVTGAREEDEVESVLELVEGEGERGRGICVGVAGLVEVDGGRSGSGIGRDMSSVGAVTLGKGCFLGRPRGFLGGTSKIGTAVDVEATGCPSISLASSPFALDSAIEGSSAGTIERTEE